MKSGIKYKDIEVGKEQQANSDDSVLVEIHFFLNNGEEINIYNSCNNNQFAIDLKSRDYIPGLRYGIVGMRKGGIRELKISPHLAFGEKGVENIIPPKALIICKVKLMKIVQNDFRLPDTYDRERQIVVSNGGEAKSNLPRWSFGIINDGDYELTVEYPIPEMTWRNTRKRNYRGKINQEEMDQIFEEVQTFPQLFPNDIIPYDNLYADSSERAGTATRERSTGHLCTNIIIVKENCPHETFYVTDETQRFQNTKLLKLISEIFKRPEIQE